MGEWLEPISPDLVDWIIVGGERVDYVLLRGAHVRHVVPIFKFFKCLAVRAKICRNRMLSQTTKCQDSNARRVSRCTHIRRAFWWQSFWLPVAISDLPLLEGGPASANATRKSLSPMRGCGKIHRGDNWTRVMTPGRLVQSLYCIFPRPMLIYAYIYQCAPCIKVLVVLRYT